MIKLQETFVSGVGGFTADPLTYTQLCRNEGAAVYERSRNGKIKDYEVFFIKVEPKGKKIFDQVLEDDREVYPNTSQFGHIAWSFGNIGAAMDRFKRLTQITRGQTPDPLPVIMSTHKSTVTPEPEISPEPIKVAPKKTTATLDLSKVKELNIPDGEFNAKGMAEFNSVSYPTAYLFIQAALQTGRVKFIRDQKGGRGKPTKIYVKA